MRYRFIVFRAQPTKETIALSIYVEVIFDEDEEERRRDYINRTEECTSELAESIKNMHAQEDLLGKSIVKVATAISKAYREDSVNLLASNEGGASGSATPLPQPTDNERLRVSLALLHSSSEAYYWSTKEMSLWKEYHLVDAMTEFGTMVDGVKDVINHSTQMLVLYEKTMQMHQSYESRANSLRVQYPSDTPSVKYANEQEVQAGREKELAHQEYTDACDMANKEMIRYERERAQGMCKALEETAKVELECARARCLELRAVCRRIRGIQLVKDPPHPRTNIGPMLWHAASMHPSMLSPNSSTPGASSSSMSTAFARTASPERSATFSDRLGAGSLASSKSAHRHSNSSGGPKLCGDFLHDTQHLASIRRAHTMDNADFAPSASNHGAGPSSAERNHSVFMETNEDDDLLLRHQHSFSATTSAAAPEPFSLSSHSSLVLLSPPKWQHAGADSRASQPRQARWNGRVSALPFQGYDPPPHSSKAPHHIVVDQSRLAEMAAEAEMEAELVRSGMLAPRKSKISLGSAAASNGGGSGGILTPNTSKRQQQQQPLALAAFRPSPLPSPSPTPSPSNSRLRQTSSHADLSAISQPVSASEYLQYSRQTLHTSLSQQASQKHLRPSSSSSGIGSSTSRGKSGPASTAAGSSRSAVAVRAHQRRDKGKARAFAV
ncbi:hypothetical protein GGI02_002340 [Coemansia sp. RSA 2322]|nr:hypothetical protein GGI02_002340 [Coemansia sp. RSA 2322]KAJ2487196.1 hypothetical protein EV174_000677 [Coemansia sp. RSA 2320]